MSLNKVMLIGNVTKDPETRNTPGGQSVTTFSLATNLNWTDASGQKQTRADFHNIVAWRRLAEICAQYLHKGSKVFIEGRIQNRDWVATDGTKKYRTEVVAENVQILDKLQQKPAQSEEIGEIQIPEADDDEIKIENIPF